jgi:hypothetical protein
MTYLDTERSIQDNKPIELYRFERADIGKKYLYTSSQDPITFLTETYEPIFIQRSDIEQTEDIDKSDIRIDISTESILVREYVSETILDKIELNVYRENAGGYALIFPGVVDAISVRDPSSSIVAVPVMKAMEGDVLSITHSIQCPYQLYDQTTCKVSSVAFSVAGEIESITGTSITSADFSTKPNGWFIGGEIVSGGRRRMIIEHTGDTITVSPYLNAVIGGSYVAYAGCGHNVSDCNTKFSNLDNYGGEPSIPSKDPWNKRIA